jgi:hypothetical protein
MTQELFSLRDFGAIKMLRGVGHGDQFEVLAWKTVCTEADVTTASRSRMPPVMPSILEKVAPIT